MAGNPNLELNKKSVQAFKKLFRILNEESYSKIEIKDKIRIGIVSEFFTDHTIMKLFRGIIYKLNKDIFVCPSDYPYLYMNNEKTNLLILSIAGVINLRVFTTFTS